MTQNSKLSNFEKGVLFQEGRSGRLIEKIWGVKADDDDEPQGNLLVNPKSKDEKEDVDDDLDFLQELEAPNPKQELAECKQIMIDSCLGRYYEEFSREFLQCITTDTTNFTIEKLENFEREKIGSKAKLKHKKYQQFIRKYTKYKNYQSVFDNGININNISVNNVANQINVCLCNLSFNILELAKCKNINHFICFLG